MSVTDKIGTVFPVLSHLSPSALGVLVNQMASTAQSCRFIHNAQSLPPLLSLPGGTVITPSLGGLMHPEHCAQTSLPPQALPRLRATRRRAFLTRTRSDCSRRVVAATTHRLPLSG